MNEVHDDDDDEFRQRAAAAAAAPRRLVVTSNRKENMVMKRRIHCSRTMIAVIVVIHATTQQRQQQTRPATTRPTLPVAVYGGERLKKKVSLSRVTIADDEFFYTMTRPATVCFVTSEIYCEPTLASRINVLSSLKTFQTATDNTSHTTLLMGVVFSRSYLEHGAKNKKKKTNTRKLCNAVVKI